MKIETQKYNHGLPILWQCESNLFLGFVNSSIFFLPIIALTLFSILLFEHSASEIAFLYLFASLFLIAYLLSLASFIDTSFLLTNSELVKLNSFIFFRVKTLPLSDVIEVLIKDSLISSLTVNVSFYYKGTDAEGWQNRIVIYGVRDVESFVKAIEHINSLSDNKIQLTRSKFHQ